MSHIITSGLGGGSLITQGYGGKWKKAEIPKHKTRIELCPHCGEVLKNHIYYSTDVLSGRKIYRCSHCYGTLRLEEGRWVAVLEWYEKDSW